MSEEVLVKVEGVSKKFCRSLKRSLWYGVQDVASEMIGRKDHHKQLRKNEFWAVNDISFELKRGECLGLIGRNGAGKTTLLRMLNGLIPPDVGRIRMRGDVGAMIAIGTGAKDILTGRENAYAMAAMRGIGKREVDRKIQEIVEFAELEDAIDSPVQNYSSGMRVRLNFAVASALEPDVLLLDEVLAVGDTSFRNKCYSRISEIRRNAAVIFVSHNMEQIARICSSAAVLNKGKIEHLGAVEQGIEKYEELNGELQSQVLTRGAFLSLSPPIKNFSARLNSHELSSGEPLQILLEIESDTELSNFAIKVLFYNARGAFSADGLLSSDVFETTIRRGNNKMHIEIPSLPLKNGTYAVAFNISDEAGDLVVWSFKQHVVRIRGAYVGGIADCQLKILFKGDSAHE